MASENRTCPFCDKCFANETIIKDHLKLFHLDLMPNPFKAKQLKIEPFENHEHKIQPSEIPNIAENYCEFCGRTFSTEKFQDHLENCTVIFKQKYSGNKFQCKNCKKSFVKRNAFTKHVNSVHTKIQFPCDHCDKSFASKMVLKSHYKTKHSKNLYTCNYCEMTFYYSNTLKEHLESIHSNEVVKIEQFPNQKCEFCGKNIHSNLNIHIEKCQIIYHEKYSGNQYQCKECKMSFNTTNALQKHVLYGHRNKRTKCELCPKKFINLRDLRIHNQVVHLGILLNCDHCEMSFKSRQGLQDHKKFSCKKVVKYV